MGGFEGACLLASFGGEAELIDKSADIVRLHLDGDMRAAFLAEILESHCSVPSLRVDDDVIDLEKRHIISLKRNSDNMPCDKLSRGAGTSKKVNECFTKSREPTAFGGVLSRNEVDIGSTPLNMVRDLTTESFVRVVEKLRYHKPDLCERAQLANPSQDPRDIKDFPLPHNLLLSSQLALLKLTVPDPGSDLESTRRRFNKLPTMPIETPLVPVFKVVALSDEAENELKVIDGEYTGQGLQHLRAGVLDLPGLVLRNETL
jgi:hypothetical protein